MTGCSVWRKRFLGGNRAEFVPAGSRSLERERKVVTSARFYLNLQLGTAVIAARDVLNLGLSAHGGVDRPLRTGGEYLYTLAPSLGLKRKLTSSDFSCVGNELASWVMEDDIARFKRRTVESDSAQNGVSLRSRWTTATVWDERDREEG